MTFLGGKSCSSLSWHSHIVYTHMHTPLLTPSHICLLKLTITHTNKHSHKHIHAQNIHPRATLPQQMCTVALNNLTAQAMQGYFTTIYTCTHRHKHSHSNTSLVKVCIWATHTMCCPWDLLLKTGAYNLLIYKQHNWEECVFMNMHKCKCVCFPL